MELIQSSYLCELMHLQNIPYNEIELSLLLCSTHSQENISRIEQLFKKKIDWDFFKRYIIRNRIHAIVYKQLKPFSTNLPETVIHEIRDLSFKTASRSLLYSIFLLNILNIFKKESIFVLPFKGPALAEQVYKDIVVRPFSDLDILVDKSNAYKAYSILFKNGFIPQIHLNESQFKKYINDEDHFVFYYPEKKIVLELHWDISGLYLSKPTMISDIQPYLETGTLNGTTIPCLSPEALLVYLCVHGTTHSWEYLEQLCSVAELIKSNPEFDWEKAIKIASEWQCKKMILIGLFIVHSILNTPLPKHLLILINSHSSVLDIGNLIKKNLFLKESNSKKGNRIYRFSLFHIRVRDSISDQIRYCSRLLFRPTDQDWAYYPLPASLCFLHYLLRPIRLILLKFRKANT